MNYELKDVKWNGPAYTMTPDPSKPTEVIGAQSIIIATGIVGEKYGFVAMDSTVINFPMTGLDAQGISAAVLKGAQDFVSAKYPNY